MKKNYLKIRRNLGSKVHDRIFGILNCLEFRENIILPRDYLTRVLEEENLIAHKDAYSIITDTGRNYLNYIRNQEE